MAKKKDNKKSASNNDPFDNYVATNSGIYDKKSGTYISTPPFQPRDSYPDGIDSQGNPYKHGKGGGDKKAASRAEGRNHLANVTKQHPTSAEIGNDPSLVASNVTPAYQHNPLDPNLVFAPHLAKIMQGGNPSYRDPDGLDYSTMSIQDFGLDDLGGLMGNQYLMNPAKYKDAQEGALPADAYYPHFRNNPIVGNVSGSMIGSQPIFAPSASLAPNGMMDARRQVLSDAARQSYYRQEAKAEAAKAPEIPTFDTYAPHKEALNREAINDISTYYQELSANGRIGALSDPSTPEYATYMQMVNRYNSLGATITELEEMTTEMEKKSADPNAYISDDTLAAVRDFREVSGLWQKGKIDASKVFDQMERMKDGMSLTNVYSDFFGLMEGDIAASLGDAAFNKDGVPNRAFLAKNKSRWMSEPELNRFTDLFMEQYAHRLKDGVYSGMDDKDVRGKVKTTLTDMVRKQLGVEWSAYKEDAGGGSSDRNNMFFWDETSKAGNQMVGMIAQAENFDQAAQIFDNSTIEMSNGQQVKILKPHKADNGGLLLNTGVKNTNSTKNKYTGDEVWEMMKKQFDGVPYANAFNLTDQPIPTGSTVEGWFKDADIAFVRRDDPDGTPLTVEQINNLDPSKIKQVARVKFRFNDPINNMDEVQANITRAAKNIQDGNGAFDGISEDDKTFGMMMRFAASLSGDKASYDTNGFSLTQTYDLEDDVQVAELDAKTDNTFRKAFFNAGGSGDQSGSMFDEYLNNED